MAPKLIIISAPSGAGKSTLVSYLLSKDLGLEFSISATSRKPRGKEQNGKEYYFFTKEQFEDKIKDDAFVEYEEVYNGSYYGTLRSEIKRIAESGNTVIFDVDVVGGLNLKKQFGKEALAIFIAPPSIEALENRLKSRQTDSEEMIKKRVGKAAYEMSFAPQFDIVIVNDNLEKAEQEIIDLVKGFLDKNH